MTTVYHSVRSKCLWTTSWCCKCKLLQWCLKLAYWNEGQLYTYYVICELLYVPNCRFVSKVSENMWSCWWWVNFWRTLMKRSKVCLFVNEIWKPSWQLWGRRLLTLCQGAAGALWRSTRTSHRREPTSWSWEAGWWAGPSHTGWSRRRGSEGKLKWWWWRKTPRWGLYITYYITLYI